LFIADFAVSTNHSSAGSALLYGNGNSLMSEFDAEIQMRVRIAKQESRPKKWIIPLWLWVYAPSREGPDGAGNNSWCYLMNMSRWISRKSCNFNRKMHIKNQLPQKSDMVQRTDKEHLSPNFTKLSINSLTHLTF
jgi:hypothetical protein